MNKICNQCDKRGKTLIHHKDLNHNNDAESNRIELCYHCHTQVHLQSRQKHNQAQREVGTMDISEPGWSKDMTWDELLETKHGTYGYG